MAIFEKFPYTDLHTLNLDWMIEKVKQWQSEFEEYKTELETLESSVQGLIDAVEQQDDDVQAAIGQLQTALDALPQDIQDEVSEQIGPEVASRIGMTVADQLPSTVASQIEGVVGDWLDDNFTDPPLDPYLTMANGVPVAKDTGDMFDYLTSLNIEGYTPVMSNVNWWTRDLGGYWTSGGMIESDPNAAAGYFTCQPGISYRFSDWEIPETATVAVLFCRGTINDKVVHSYINKAALSDYETRTSGVYLIPVPHGCNLILVNGTADGESANYPHVVGRSLNFEGGPHVRNFSNVTPDGPLTYTPGYSKIYDDVVAGVPVSFHNVPDTETGSYLTVCGYKVDSINNTMDIAMISTSKKLITARLTKTVVSDTEYAVISDVIEINLEPDPAYTLITEGSGDYSIADTLLSTFTTAIVTDHKNVLLKYPSAGGYARVINYAGTTVPPLNITVIRNDGYLISYYVTQSGTDLLLTQNTASIDLYTAQSGGMILDVTNGTGGTYVIANETIDDLMVLMEETTPVWLSWPVSIGSELNLSLVMGWNVTNSSFGMTCIDSNGDYKRLSVTDDLETGNAILTVEAALNVENIEQPLYSFTAGSGTPTVGTFDVSWTDFNTRMTAKKPATVWLGAGYGSNAFTAILGAIRTSSTSWTLIVTRMGVSGGAITSAYIMFLVCSSAANDTVAVTISTGASILA